MSQNCTHGVFYTPHQQSISQKMDKIHSAAQARSNNPYFWDYTKEERQELCRLSAEYWREAHADD